MMMEGEEFGRSYTNIFDIPKPIEYSLISPIVPSSVVDSFLRGGDNTTLFSYFTQTWKTTTPNTPVVVPQILEHTYLNNFVSLHENNPNHIYGVGNNNICPTTTMQDRIHFVNDLFVKEDMATIKGGRPKGKTHVKEQWTTEEDRFVVFLPIFYW